MATTGVPANPTAQTISGLLSKLTDQDPDFRFMALNDLIEVLTKGKNDILVHDYNISARTVDSLVKALGDANGEVQQLAVKCLGKLATKVPANIVGPMMERLIQANPPDASLPPLALCEVIKGLPRPVPGVTPTEMDVVNACKAITGSVVPRFVNPELANTYGWRKPDNAVIYKLGRDQTVTPETINVVIEVSKCFGYHLAPPEVHALLWSLFGFLEGERQLYAARKQTVLAISILSVHLVDQSLGMVAKRLADVLGKADLTTSSRRLYFQLMGSLARSVPRRLEGPLINTLAPFLFQDLSQKELDTHLERLADGDDGGDYDEVRESALVTLESFLSALPQEMRVYTDRTIAACLRFLTYDPNYVNDDDDDEEMASDGEEDGDDDSELGEDFDDDDDGSWKVRRCACKALYTLVSTRASGDLLESGNLYHKVAPVLVKRFDEREENVRLEVISTLGLLVRKTGEGLFPADLADEQEPDLTSSLPANRKRRRQSSVGGSVTAGQLTNVSGLTSPTLEKTPMAGPRADLARLTPNIIKASTKQLKGKVLPTKQAVVGLLDDMVNTQRGGLGEFFPSICPYIIECVNKVGGSSSLIGSGGNATGSTLRIAALKLVSDISKTHSSSLLQQYLSKIVSAVILAVNDKFYKISSEAVRSAEELVKTITPPRARQTAHKFRNDLQRLFVVLLDRAKATNADAEVRQRAIHALGTLVSRTSSVDGAALLSAEERREALGTLLTLLKTETGRLASAKALDSVAVCSTSSTSFDQAWMQEVVLELSNQLRKSNRQLRGACILTLKHVTDSPGSKGQLTADTVKHLMSSLLPVIDAKDAYLMGPALTILGNLVEEQADLIVTPDLTAVLCKFLKDGSPTIQVVIESLLFLVSTIGRSGKGKDLMQGLLKHVGVEGDPAVLGQLIGTLLVSGGNTLGVTLEAFTQELNVGAELGDDNRVSLALAVLGEAGMRLGARSTLSPQLFLGQFRSEPDKVSRAAAVALGRAGSTNVAKYLPVILPKMKKEGNEQYLLVQSTKEILSQIATLSSEIEPFADTMWDRLLDASVHPDNRVACAECIGRLVILEPGRFMPRLQALLKDQSQAVRGMAVQAVRYTLPDSDEAFDGMLKNVLVDMLYTMLQDSDMEIRRLSMTTLNSAAHNKPDLILPHIGTLMPFVIKESVVKEELIRTVMMGPFKHTVDDGLEVRKSAYETLYALMETVFSRINRVDFFDRVIAGLKDDNDIRSLCNLMISKLVIMDPEETMRRLDSIATVYRTVLSTKLKEGAVKQEVEKQTEANKSILRVTLLLNEKVPAAGAPGAADQRGTNQTWKGYWDWVTKEFAAQLKMLREENKETRS